MSTPGPSLRIAVLGAGRIGSAFAFQLARTGGHDVTVIARPDSARLRQLQRDGAIIDVTGQRAPVGIASALDEHTRYDLVIVTLLAHQVGMVLPALQRSAATCIQFMFNMFQPELLLAAIGPERCAFGMPFVQAMLTDDGRLQATIGAGGQKTLLGRQACVDTFNAAGLPAVLQPDMPLWLRCHAPICVAFESICVAGAARRGGASWAEARTVSRGVHACFKLIQALGHPPYPRAKKLIAGSPPALFAATLWALSRVRSFRELLATGQTECSALVDTMLGAAPPGFSASLLADISAMRPAIANRHPRSHAGEPTRKT